MQKKSKVLAIIIMTIGMFLVILGDVILFDNLQDDSSSNNQKTEVVSDFQKLINDIKNYNSYKIEVNLNKDSNKLYNQIILLDQKNKLEKLDNKTEDFIIDLTTNNYYKLIGDTYNNINNTGIEFENDMLGILKLLEYNYENVEFQDNQMLEFTLNKNTLKSYLENKNYYLARQLQMLDIKDLSNDGKIIVNILESEIRSIIIEFVDINNSNISLVLTISDVNIVEDFSNFKETLK